MATYAQIENGVIINVVEADEEFATEQSLTLIDGADPMPGIGWSLVNGTWTEPIPDPAQVGAANATAVVTQVLDARSEFAQQIESDSALWQATTPGTSLTQEHIDSMVRVVNGFQTVLEAMQAHMVLTDTIPAETMS